MLSNAIFITIDLTDWILQLTFYIKLFFFIIYTITVLFTHLATEISPLMLLLINVLHLTVKPLAVLLSSTFQLQSVHL